MSSEKGRTRFRVSPPNILDRHCWAWWYFSQPLTAFFLPQFFWTREEQKQPSVQSEGFTLNNLLFPCGWILQPSQRFTGTRIRALLISFRISLLHLQNHLSSFFTLIHWSKYVKSGWSPLSLVAFCFVLMGLIHQEAGRCRGLSSYMFSSNKTFVRNKCNSYDKQMVQAESLKSPTKQFSD